MSQSLRRGSRGLLCYEAHRDLAVRQLDERTGIAVSGNVKPIET